VSVPRHEKRIVQPPVETRYECRLCGQDSRSVPEAERHARACPEHRHLREADAQTYAPYYARSRIYLPRAVREKEETFVKRRVRRFIEEGRPL
jgi:hypothetical protein